MKGKALKRVVAFMLSFVLIFSGCFMLKTNEVFAADSATTFTISSDKEELHRGDTVKLTLSMSGNVEGAGLQMTFTYDPDILELGSEDDITWGTVFDDFGRMDIADIYPIAPGQINVVIARSEDSITNGTIFTAEFTVKEDAKGLVETDCTSIILINSVYENLDSTVVNEASSMKVVVPATGISLDQTSLTLAKGSSETLKAELTPADADETVTWTSSDDSVATVDASGTVTAVGKGTATITTKAGEHTASCKVTVNIPLNGISITGNATTIKRGQTTQLTVVYDPEDTTDDRSVTWTSSEPSVASVNENGLVTALQDGETTITAAVGDKTASYNIRVQEIKLTSINIKESTTIHKGDSETLAITYEPEDTTDSKTATWTSSDTSIVTVDGNGTVTAVAPGSAIVTARVGNFEDSCIVTVDAPLTGIDPAEDSMELVKGQTGIITYSLVPSDTTDSREVSFTSSDPSVASVDADGNVTALKAGTAVITLAGANNITAEVSVTVSEIPISGISLDTYSKVLEKGESAELHATIEPADNTDDDQTVTWSSSDTSIVTVTAHSADSTKATVTAVPGSKGGTATITARSWNGAEAVCEITVPKHIESISLPDGMELLKGKTAVLDVTVNPADTDDDTTVTWTSSDPSVATVDENTGMITGIKEGTAEITATTRTLNTETQQPFTATTTVTIKENHLTDELAGMIGFDEDAYSLFKGQSIALNEFLNLNDIIAQNQITDAITIEWTSSDETVAAADQTGTVLGLQEGTAVITVVIKAVDGNGNEQTYQAETGVNVTEIPLESIAFDKVITEMQVGAKDTLNVIYNPADTTDTKDVEWSSSDSSIISVEDGVLTALKEGTATITATVGDKSVSCTITVKDPSQNVTSGENNSNGAANTGVESSSSDNVKTGDSTNVVLYVILIMAGAAVLVSASLRIRKRRINR